MANQKLTDLTAATTPLTGAEQVYLVQGGASKRATAQQLADFPGEWSGETVSQAEAEAGTATTRRAWTAQRVAQAVAAWWAASAAASKLAGIASGATANATDAQLRDRSTHTGTQPAATITGLATVATTGAYADLSGRPTLGTSAALDVAAAGDAASGQVVRGNDSRLSDARTPTAHTQLASTISDSTAAGRALLTATDAAAQRTSLGLGTASTTDASAYATAAQGAKADTALQPEVLSGYVQTSDARLSDSREWSAATIGQAEAEAGTATTRRAFTAQRVFQAAAAWWAASAAKTKLDGIEASATNTPLSNATPQAPGTAAAGTASTAARGDHVHPLPSLAALGAAASGAITSSGLTQSTARLLGRATAGTGAVEEITLGTGLSFTGATLNAAGGSPGGSSGQLQWNNGGTFAGLSTSSIDGSGNLTLTGRLINSLNGAASAPPLSLTGTWFTGGTATTTKPQLLVEPAGTTSTAWSTSGTGLGVNAPSGFAGNLLDLQVNGTSAVKVDPASGITALFASSGNFAGISVTNTGNSGASSSGLTATNNTTAQLYARSYGSTVTNVTVFGVTLANCAFVGTLGAASEGLLVGTVTAKPFVLGTNDTERIRITSSGLITFGGTTSSFPALKRSSAILQARLADDSGYTTIDAQHRLQGTAPASATATGTAGDIRYDADYVYVCTATNTWKRAALSTW